jgi:hypothetical protein
MMTVVGSSKSGTPYDHGRRPDQRAGVGMDHHHRRFCHARELAAYIQGKVTASLFKASLGTRFMLKASGKKTAMQKNFF